jgi:hypothetical protein
MNHSAPNAGKVCVYVCVCVCGGLSVTVLQMASMLLARGTANASKSDWKCRLAGQGPGARWNEEKMNECHQAVTKFIVKGLHPFPTVEQPHFR